MKKTMSIVILIVAVGIVFFSLVGKANADRKFQDWKGSVKTYEMTGKKTHYIYTMSLNKLNGWLRNGYLALAYNEDKKSFVVMAHNLGLKNDHNGNQYVRMKVDDSNPSDWDFHIYEDNNDAMFLAASSKGSVDDLFESMKPGFYTLKFRFLTPRGKSKSLNSA